MVSTVRGLLVPDREMLRPATEVDAGIRDRALQKLGNYFTYLVK